MDEHEREPAALLSPPPEEASVSPAASSANLADQQQEASTALVERLRGYVASACARLLLDEEAPDQALTEALRVPGALAALARFVADARAPVLYLDSYVPTGAFGGFGGMWACRLVDRWN